MSLLEVPGVVWGNRSCCVFNWGTVRKICGCELSAMLSPPALVSTIWYIMASLIVPSEDRSSCTIAFASCNGLGEAGADLKNIQQWNRIKRCADQFTTLPRRDWCGKGSSKTRNTALTTSPKCLLGQFAFRSGVYSPEGTLARFFLRARYFDKISI